MKIMLIHFHVTFLFEKLVWSIINEFVPKPICTDADLSFTYRLIKWP